MHEPLYTLITGASRGLGRALAIECARRNRNLVLVSLPDPALHQTASYIKIVFGVHVICIEKDLCDPKGCADVFHEVQALGIQVNILVNNAGTGSTDWFTNNSIDFYEQQIRLNILVTMQLTHLFLPMLQQRPQSYILNVGSLASFFTLPKKTVYSGTKQFVYTFSRSLRQEMAEKQVFVSVVCPGGMPTCPAAREMVAKGNYLTRASCMEPEEVASVAMNGLLRRKAVIIPGKWNRFFFVLDSMLPSFLKTWLVARTMKRLHSQRGPGTVIRRLPKETTVPSFSLELK